MHFPERVASVAWAAGLLTVLVLTVWFIVGQWKLRHDAEADALAGCRAGPLGEDECARRIGENSADCWDLTFDSGSERRGLRPTFDSGAFQQCVVAASAQAWRASHPNLQRWMPGRTGPSR